MSPLAAGKLPASLLAELLAQLHCSDPRVITGPGIGRDAAVIDMGSHYLVAKTDPITFATDDIGRYAVNVNANDIACLGARPRWFLATALLPAGRADEGLARRIFDQITQACADLDIALVGGHTEITHDLPRPLVIGALLGEVAKDKLVASGGAHDGDAIVLTKTVPLEGTALIAREKGEELRQRGMAPELVDRAAALLVRPGISIVREALIAAEAGLATSMHDPTEGGLATGLAELAIAANAGLVVDEMAVPFLPDALQVCSAFGLDPWGVIASGSLLVTVRPQDVARLQQAYATAGIPSAVIGRIVTENAGLVLEREGARRPLPQFPVDEIARLFV